MAKKALVEYALNIRQIRWAFGIGETCYRYEAELSDENAEITDWLLQLTAWQRNWGFGLFFCICAM
jgi:putative transposase